MSAFTAPLSLASRTPTVFLCPSVCPATTTTTTNNVHEKNGSTCSKPNALITMILSDRETKAKSKSKSKKSKSITNDDSDDSDNNDNNDNKNSTTPPTMSSSSSTTNLLRISGNNVALTDSLRAYVVDKLGKVTSRYNSILTKMDVHLTVEHNPSIKKNRNKVEVIVFSGKTILRSEVRMDDMYAAIDCVHDKISRTIRKFKERRDNTHKPTTTSITPLNDEDDEDEDEDQYKDVYETKQVAPGVPLVNEVIRRKVFPMPLQTVQEAVLCCEYVDHPWYLFRNADTKEICLVYKRNHGGYGLIEPSNPDSNDDEPVV